MPLRSNAFLGFAVFAALCGCSKPAPETPVGPAAEAAPPEVVAVEDEPTAVAHDVSAANSENAPGATDASAKAAIYGAIDASPQGNATMSLEVKGGCYHVIACDEHGSSLLLVASAKRATAEPLHIGIRWGKDELNHGEKVDAPVALGPKATPVRFSTQAPCNVLIELLIAAETAIDEGSFQQRVTKKCADGFR